MVFIKGRRKKTQSLGVGRGTSEITTHRSSEEGEIGEEGGRLKTRSESDPGQHLGVYPMLDVEAT